MLNYQQSKSLGPHLSGYQSASAPGRFRLALVAANAEDTLLTAPLIEQFDDAIPPLREGLAFALGQMDCDQSRVQLLDLLANDLNHNVRTQSLYALGHVADLPSIEKIVYDIDITGLELDFLRALVYYFQRDVVTPGRISFCLDFLKETQTDYRRWAAYALSRIRDKPLLQRYRDGILAARDASDPVVRTRMAALLRQIDFERKGVVYAQFLSDRSAAVRVEAVRALPTLSDAGLLWTQALQDSQPHVLSTVLSLLPSDISMDQSRSKLLYALSEHSEPHIRGLTLQYILGRWGPDTLKVHDLWPVPPELLPYKVKGLAQWKRHPAWPQLNTYTHHHQSGVSTPAYQGLLQIARENIRQQQWPLDSLRSVVYQGLQSRDPVQMALAAAAIKDTAAALRDLTVKMEKRLRELQTPRDNEAILAMLGVITQLEQVSAIPSVERFIDSPTYIIRYQARATIMALDSSWTDRSEIRPYRAAAEQISLIQLAQYGLSPQVQIQTARGSFTIGCDGYYAPYTTAAFLKLVEAGFYNGLSFHRVVPNFVVQGGDPRGDGWGGPDFTLLTERSPLTYACGSVGMASSGKNTEGSQFFITLSAQPHLDYEYTRFGSLVDGMQVVEKLMPGDQILSARIIK